METMDALFASPWLGPFAIFCMRIVDVSCDTMRVIFAIRGKRGVAAVLGFIQALVWIFAVGNAVRHLDSLLHIVGYAAGFSTGTFVVITIENALAYGMATVRIVSKHGGVEIAEGLRAMGYGVTEQAGFGREGGVEIVSCVVRRAHLTDVLRIIDQWDTNAFVTVEEPRILRGGSLAKRTPRVSNSIVKWSERLRQRA